MTATNSRRFRYSLRTLFVVVTLAACAAGWVSHQLKWIRERQRVITTPHVHAVTYTLAASQAVGGPIVTKRTYSTAPWPLRWMGETGYAGIMLADGASDAAVERARALFPDAEVVEYEEPPLDGE